MFVGAIILRRGIVLDSVYISLFGRLARNCYWFLRSLLEVALTTHIQHYLTIDLHAFLSVSAVQSCTILFFDTGRSSQKIKYWTTKDSVAEKFISFKYYISIYVLIRKRHPRHFVTLGRAEYQFGLLYCIRKCLQD